MEVPEAARLPEREEENRKLKRLAGELVLARVQVRRKSEARFMSCGLNNIENVPWSDAHQAKNHVITIENKRLPQPAERCYFRQEKGTS